MIPQLCGIAAVFFIRAHLLHQQHQQIAVIQAEQRPPDHFRRDRELIFVVDMPQIHRQNLHIRITGKLHRAADQIRVIRAAAGIPDRRHQQLGVIQIKPSAAQRAEHLSGVQNARIAHVIVYPAQTELRIVLGLIGGVVGSAVASLIGLKSTNVVGTLLISLGGACLVIYLYRIIAPKFKK